MNRSLLLLIGFAAGVLTACPNAHGQTADSLHRLKYNNPDLVVDLGVGLWAWPLPMDFDGDGDLDLVVCCPDKPYNGAYFFENASGEKFPVFRPGVRFSRGLQDAQVCFVDGRPRVLTAGAEHADFMKTGLDAAVRLPVPANIHNNRVRANQWKYCDYDGDGVQDVIVGVGDWTEYGWDDAFDASGKWTRGPLHGYVYLVHNAGSNDAPDYDKPAMLRAGGQPVDVYGRPSPNFADFDGDGDLDLLCGEFLDGFTYFENAGTRSKPKYNAGRRLPMRMDLQMIAPVTIDWDGDGDTDLIVGDEDGRVALVEHTGRVTDGLPQFLAPRYFQQQADEVKFGALSTPCGFDWDGDGDDDIICGNTAGYIAFIENLSGAKTDAPRWAAPRKLEADGKVIRIQAGPNGSIQGPCEAKWGYTTVSVGDWDHDGLPDIVANSIWGKVVWYRNAGTRRRPQLAAAQPVEVAWPAKPPKPEWNWWDPAGNDLVTQWRTTPVVVDWNRDGLNDLVMLDHEGYLALFARQRADDGSLQLLPGRRVFIGEAGQPLRLNAGRAGRSGRRKLCAADWDGDGRMDLLVNSINADWLRNIETRDGKYVLKNMGPLDTRAISSHSTCPTVVDFNGDGVPDLLIGAEDGHFYYKRNPRSR